MIKFTDKFLEDKKANNILQGFINNRLLALLEAEMKDYHKEGYSAIQEDDIRFSLQLENLFPPRYPHEKMVNTFLRLYALLQSKETFPLEKIMEYVMNQLIQSEVEYCQEMNLSTRQTLTPQRDYVISKLQEEIDEETVEVEETDDIDMSIFDAEREIEIYENLIYYSSICFPDESYMNLDKMTEDQIIQSGMEDKINVCFRGTHTEFIVPAVWRK